MVSIVCKELIKNLNINTNYIYRKDASGHLFDLQTLKSLYFLN